MSERNIEPITLITPIGHAELLFSAYDRMELRRGAPNIGEKYG